MGGQYGGPPGCQFGRNAAALKVVDCCFLASAGAQSVHRLALFPAVDWGKRPSQQRLSDSLARQRRVQIGSVLVVIATGLVNLPGLRLIVGAVALIVILLRLLLID